jgi:meckelin
LINNSGGSVKCQPCPTNEIQAFDGFSCIKKTENPKCDNGYFQDFNTNGVKYPKRTCVECDLKISVPTLKMCQSCKPLVIIDNSNQQNFDIDCSRLKLDGGVFFFNESVSGQPNYYKVVFDRKEFDSWLVEQFSRSTYRTCKPENTRNITACQALSNLCVLNLYNKLSGSNQIDVCEALEDLNINQNVQNTLPITSYEETLGAYKSFYKQNGIESEFLSLNLNRKPDSMVFYAAEYDLNGNLVNFDIFDAKKLQICSLFTSFTGERNFSAFRATNIHQTCSIKIERLFSLADSNPLRFIELYLRYGNGTNMIPIPVKILNYKPSGFLNGPEINRVGNENEHRIQRRFFLYETVSSKPSIEQDSAYIRYAKSISINFELLEDKTRGEIYPPIITIDYDSAKRIDSENYANLEFKIEYKMSLSNFFIGFFVTLGVLGFMGILWTLIRIWNWSRRSARFAADIVTFFKFFIFLFGFLSNALLLTLVGSSIYWLIFYKAQQYAFLVPPTPEQEKIFSILLIVAFALKFIDIIHLIFEQSSYDIFLIDWERPNNFVGKERKLLKNNNILQRLGKAKDENDLIISENNEKNLVSCWRTLFVCNEWNELQTYRKTNTAFQLIMVLFFLKVIDLEQFSTRDLTSKYNLKKNLNDYEAPFSMLLRIGIASSMYIGIGLFQWLFYTLFYSKCIEDKLGQFVDFCSISNISMFIMTHTQFGYYIHGRSPLGFADTSLQKMIESLAKEAEDLTAKRGLEPNTNHQSFSISVSSKLTQQYGKVINPIYQVIFVFN